MVAVPEVDGLTQARRLSDVALMARELVAVTTGADVGDVEIVVHVRSVGSVVDVDARLELIRNARAEALRLEREASRDAAALARDLVGQEVPLRDVGAISGCRTSARISWSRPDACVSAPLVGSGQPATTGSACATSTGPAARQRSVHDAAAPGAHWLGRRRPRTVQTSVKEVRPFVTSVRSWRLPARVSGDVCRTAAPPNGRLRLSPGDDTRA